MSIQRYETTKEMNHAHSQWYIQYLHTNRKMPVTEIHERLMEIRCNLQDRADELRFIADVKAINEEFAEMTKSMIFYDRLFPQVEQEIYRVLRDLETICAEGYRAYIVGLNLDSFQENGISLTLMNDGKPIQFKTNSKFSRYRGGFPPKWLDMDAVAIKKEMR